MMIAGRGRGRGTSAGQRNLEFLAMLVGSRLGWLTTAPRRQTGGEIAACPAGSGGLHGNIIIGKGL